jgi:exodeoxyribonuclease V beta subunit
MTRSAAPVTDAIPLDAFAVPIPGSGSSSGTMLVEASAGTGKTHTITSLFVRLVLEQGLSVKEILVVTFTDAATAELRDRTRLRLRAAARALEGEATEDTELAALVAALDGPAREMAKARAREALREMDLAAITTIHAFCMRMLQEHAFESGARFDLTLRTDTPLLVDDVATDSWTRAVVGLPPALFALRAGTRGFDWACAQKIAAAVARRPADTPTLPAARGAHGAPVNVATIAAVAQRAFAAARARWQAEGPAVKGLLARSLGGLKANMYPAGKLEDAYATLDAVFSPSASAELPLDLAPVHEVCGRLGASALARGTKKGARTPSHPLFDALDELGDLLERASAGLVTALRRGTVDFVRAELPRRKYALRAQGFEDLLFALDAALDPARGPRATQLAARIASQFRAALLDEFQDTDPVQYRIFRRVFHGRSALFLVGDPKQSIYAFRGADVRSYVSAAADAQGSRYTLGTNRRSDPSLVRAVNAIFGGRADPFRTPEIGFTPASPHVKADRIGLGRGASAFEVHFLPREGDKGTNKTWLNLHVPRLVAAEISAFLRSGATVPCEAGEAGETGEAGERAKDGTREVRPGDIAVLTRTNQQAMAVQAELRALGIPTALSSDESVFASAEAGDVSLLLGAVLEPTSARAVRSALATTVAGQTANAIAALETDEPAWDAWSERFRGWHAYWDDHGFFQAFRRMLSDLGAEARLLALVDGERRVTNLLHLGELLHAVDTRDRLGKAALLRWLRTTRARVRVSEGDALPDVPEATELRLESDAHAVKLLTIHKSKGLEFPVVYCPFLWGGRMPKDGDVAIDFHDPSDGYVLKIDVQPAKDGPSLVAKTEEVLAENQRLLYVALTRAKHRCVVVWGAVNQAADCPLAYTLHGDRYGELDDEGLLRDLADLVRRAEGAIRVVCIDRDAEGKPWSTRSPSSARPPERALAPRSFDRARVDRWFRIGSFTALASGASRGAEAPEIGEELAGDGRDHDEVDERPEAEREGDGEAVVLHAFPRGAKAGTTMHAVLEVAEFADAGGEGLRAVVASKLAEAGYADATWGATLTEGLRAVLATPLDASGMSLSRVPRARRADELAFVMPVSFSGSFSGSSSGSQADQAERRVLSSGRLADAFDANATAEMRALYTERLRAMQFPPLRGFLRGFVDLVFEHEGRFYVVDYKSNHLGARAADYRAPQLADAMVHHDYVLQYHLYVVAVHRWLASRVPGYDYDTHFGGVFYLFLRGMSPAHPPGTGVFADRPPRALVLALSEVLHA